MASTTCSIATGYYEFINVARANNETLSVFFNTNGGNTDKGVVITVAADSFNDISLNPRKNRVWLTTETGVALIANILLNDCDSDAPAQCANVPYSVSGGDLIVEQQAKLIIAAGKTFAPGGSVTLSAAPHATFPKPDIATRFP